MKCCFCIKFIYVSLSEPCSVARKYASKNYDFLKYLNKKWKNF